MFRPAHPRVMNFRPRFNPQQNFQRRTHVEPRAFYERNNVFRPRPPHSSENGNIEHWCETCDRGFPTAKHLEEHKSQHQKCNIDGCQFVAHPKVITKHIQMQHSSGLYKKISNLKNPEDIKKWIEERKKNYPTRSNIEKKAAELKEKIDRGEKMGLKSRQRFRDKKSDNKRKVEPGHKHHNDKKDFKKRKNSNDHKETEIKPKPIDTRNTMKYLPPVEKKIIMTPFAGIQALVTSIQVEDNLEEPKSDLLIEDDDHEEMAKVTQENSNPSEPVLCGALVALMGQYGSSDEEESHLSNTNTVITKIKDTKKGNDKSPNMENKENNMVSKPTNSCDINNTNDNDGSDSGPEETKVQKIDKDIDNSERTQIETTKNVKKKQNEKISNKPKIPRKQKSKLPSTLLQKLLSKEMRHERNMILQCVRYIIKQNYFE